MVEILPSIRPAVQGFWQGFARRKVKVPAIPQGGEAVVTND